MDIRLLAQAAELRGLERRFLLAAHLHHILGTLFSLQLDKKTDKKEDRGVSWVHPWRGAAWQALDRSADGKLRPAVLAKELGISLSRLTHHYRAYCRESLHKTISSWRVERACTLLSSTNLSIKEIATKVGFSHQSYFSNFLKQTMNYAPSEYRLLSKKNL